MRVISFNAEGIQSARTKGFFDWIVNQDADIICIQDLQIREEDFYNDDYQIEGYYSYLFENYLAEEKEQLAGVAIYSNVAPKAIITGIESTNGHDQGRYIQADYHNMSISSLLVPGQVESKEENPTKYDFLDDYLLFLKKQKRKRRDVITCGTFNIAHKPGDVACYNDYKNTPGAILTEQRWMDHLLNNMYYLDCYREVELEEDLFTYWSNEANRKNNVGWRIDYQLATHRIRPYILNGGIYIRGEFSRHAPVIIDYDIELKN